MARFLFVVPPLSGHVNPTVAVGEALQTRGHEVAWVGHPGAVKRLLAPGARLFELPEDPSLHPEQLRARAEALRGFAAFKQLWEEFFLPLARSTVDHVARVTRAFKPDALLVDQQTFAGALVARQLDLPWATLATTSARWTESLAGMPRVLEWLEDHFAALQREAGLAPVPDFSVSPRLLLVFSSARLAGPGFPSQTCFVGPALAGRVAPPFPFEALRPGKRLFVSLGTLNTERARGFYDLLREALGGQALQVVVAAPPELVAPRPDNFLVQSPLPQLALLKQVDAVLCHAGHNTVCEALAEGLPLLVMPIRDDQPVIAQQVVNAGCGLRLRFGRTTPAELRAALHRVFEEPGFRAAAGSVKESFGPLGGAAAAALAIEQLA